MSALLMFVPAFGAPLAAVVALLTVSARARRVREAVIARQVALTDAIHRELGAVAAPVVRKPAGRPWQVHIAVDFAHSAAVGDVLAVASEAFARFDRSAPVDFVLAPRPAGGRAKAATSSPPGS